MEHFSGASLKGRLLALSANIRPGWKGFPETKTNLFGLFVSYDEKSFIKFAPGRDVTKLFTVVIYEFSYQARVFVLLVWKSLPKANMLAY